MKTGQAKAYRLVIGGEAHEFVALDNDIATSHALKLLREVPIGRTAHLFETVGEAPPVWVVTLGGGQR